MDAITAYPFVKVPSSADYAALSRYILGASEGYLHPAILSQRSALAARLLELAADPAHPDSLSRYHMLRLFVR